jgi:hypothetical protein
MKSSASPNNIEDADADDHHGLLLHNYRKVLSALFYGIASILVIFTNKAIMTIYKFPFVNFLATVQFLVTSVVILALVLMKKIDVPVLNLNITIQVLPITLMFLGNVLCGLGSANALSIPMFTALRRFSMLMIMLAEYFLLHVKPSLPVTISVALMVGGTVVAACYDLSFDAQGYTLVFLNNMFTALNGVYMKKASLSGKVSKMGVLFYNSLFSALIMVVIFLFEHYCSQAVEDELAVLFDSPNLRGPKLDSNLGLSGVEAVVPTRISTIGQVMQHSGWESSTFIAIFWLAACMGSILNYSIFLCTTINSALTTAVVGTTKNIVATYIGMVAFPDYSFNWVNFLGINISILGSLYYNYVTIVKGAAGYGAA